MEIESAEDYTLEYDAADKKVILTINNRWIRLKLHTPILYTYNGTTWIKTSGGKAITTNELKTTLKIPDETIQKIKQLLQP